MWYAYGTLYQIVSSPYLQIVHLKKVFRSVNLLFLFFVVFVVVVCCCFYCCFCCCFLLLFFSPLSLVLIVCFVLSSMCVRIYRAILILAMLVDGPGVEHQIVYKEKSST